MFDYPVGIGCAAAIMLGGLICHLTCTSAVAAEVTAARNPIIWADVPDVALVRVGSTYYMSSTTMHMSPGVPIMKSRDLVNWDLIGYASRTLGDDDSTTLQDEKNMYGRGTWASSIRHQDGTFYVSTFSQNTGKTYVFRTADIESGNWAELSFKPSLHDHSLFFDDDGRVYMAYGAGSVRLIELTADVSGIKPDAVNQVIVPDAIRAAGSNVGLAEGSQLHKINGKYYLFMITWPRGDMRTQVVFRAEKITGPYEGRVFLHDKGVAQGCLIDTPDGKWYAALFQDNGAVGRTPFLVPVRWEDGWPVASNEGKVPMTLDMPATNSSIPAIVSSDEFTSGQELKPQWQWNHNPDDRFWSLALRPGFLRLTTGRVDAGFLQARNTLTQRTFGPQCSGMTAIDVSGMKDGDVAGLAVLQKRYGIVGVRMTGDQKSIVMVSAQSESPVELASVPLGQSTVHLKIDCDFHNRTDKAYFFYSLDGENWMKVGEPLKMAYTLPHFMGYRFALFNYATRESGGHVDFDFFRVSDTIATTK